MNRVRVLIAFAILAAGPVWAETWAEKLGWDEGDRVLILHIDDAGMSYSSNLGTYEAMTEGVANSVSVMMPCPWVPAFVDWLKEHPHIDAGLHLTMTSEWDGYRWGPLAGKPAVPGLVDEEGCLWGSVPDVVANASPDEVETEIRAQLDRARTMGFEPTHLDSHMGTLFATPAFMERYVKVGIDEGIPVMAPAGHNTLLKEQYRQATYERVKRMNISRVGDEKVDPEEVWAAEKKARFGNIDAIGQQLWQGGLPVLDDLHNTSYGWDRDEKVEKYVEGIKSIKPGVTMMIMHCSRPSEIFDEFTGSGDSRLGDLEAMLAPEVRQAIEDEGIMLTTFRELKERRDAVK